MTEQPKSEGLVRFFPWGLSLPIKSNIGEYYRRLHQTFRGNVLRLLIYATNQASSWDAKTEKCVPWGRLVGRKID